MTDLHKIIMIFAKRCKECDVMKQTIRSVIKFENINAEMIAYDCEDDEAIDVALKYGIEEVPGCYINGTVIQGSSSNSKDIIRELKKLS